MNDIPFRKAKKMKDLPCPSDNSLCKPKVPSVPLLYLCQELTFFPTFLSKVHLLIHPVLNYCPHPLFKTCSPLLSDDFLHFTFCNLHSHYVIVKNNMADALVGII